MPSLSELVLRVRNLVFDAGLGTFELVNFVRVASGGDDTRMDAVLSDEHFIKGKAFYLAIDADPVGDTGEIVKFVQDPDGFKLLPTATAQSRVRGLALTEDRFPPLSLPSRPGRVYFKVDESSNTSAWAKMREDKKVSVVWSQATNSSLGVTLVIDTTGKNDG